WRNSSVHARLVRAAQAAQSIDDLPAPTTRTRRPSTRAGAVAWLECSARPLNSAIPSMSGTCGWLDTPLPTPPDPTPSVVDQPGTPAPRTLPRKGSPSGALRATWTTAVARRRFGRSPKRSAYDSRYARTCGADGKSSAVAGYG